MEVFRDIKLPGAAPAGEFGRRAAKYATSLYQIELAGSLKRVSFLRVRGEEGEHVQGNPQIQESTEELKQLQKQERHRLKQQRLHALDLVASGQARERQQVAALVGVSRTPVARWLDRYEEGGREALVSVKPLPDKAPALAGAQLAELHAALARPAGFGSSGEIQAWIRSELGVEMKSQAVPKLVHDNLGVRLTVARPRPPKQTRRP